MRVMMTLASAGFVLSLVPVPAFAAPCPFPMVQECSPQPQNRPPTTPMQCRCVNPPGSPTWGGKAENVAASQRAFAHRAKMNGLAALGHHVAGIL